MSEVDIERDINVQSSGGAEARVNEGSLAGEIRELLVPREQHIGAWTYKYLKTFCFCIKTEIYHSELEVTTHRIVAVKKYRLGLGLCCDGAELQFYNSAFNKDVTAWRAHDLQLGTGCLNDCVYGPVGQCCCDHNALHMRTVTINTSGADNFNADVDRANLVAIRKAIVEGVSPYKNGTGPAPARMM